MNFLRRVGLLCCLVLPLHAAEPLQLRLLTEDYPPFSMQLADGRIGGLSSDIVREILRRAGIGYRIELLPWVRAYNSAVLEPNTCVYSTTRTEQREHQLQWIGPVVENPWVLYGRDDGPQELSNLEAARRYRLGGYSGDAVAQYLISRGFEVDLASNDVQNLRKLQAGRIDLWATGKYLGAALVAREKAARLRPLLTFNTTFLYLACNQMMADGTVRLLNEHLRGMHKDGTVARINARYLND
ncbi:substrate-binding periplasmic protein [Vogesella indigofera]|uniref:substrate-binding periplasmic protein n=1 Tax=Vogesella indigofera TaxID=45465 RepID=UPI00234F50A9|nr:transporter substrate-binding domain-containing protein [Vogesella indigofera]MDC7698887.1 transporter substrate-binding domain-containing protein [Vogesella indigofera]